MKAEITTTPLEHLANDIRERDITDEEAFNNDITNLFWEDCHLRIKSGELINIQIRGLGATGKSTVAAEIIWELNTSEDFLGTEALRKFIEKFQRLILSDQTEFMRFRKKGLKRIAVVIDEYNKMSDTGLNATTERALNQQYSDIFTQNFVHRINCTVKEVVDANAYLILDIKGRNLKSGLTRLKVRYRDVTEGGMSIVIGYIDIDVSEVIKQKWYQAYRKKKFKRMELLEKHGIRDIRDPEFAIVTTEVEKRVRDLASIRKINRPLARGKIDEVLREMGIIYSILTVDEIVGRVTLLTDLLFDIKKEKKKFNKAKKGKEKEEAKKAIDILTNTYKERLKQEQEWAKLYEEYLEME